MGLLEELAVRCETATSSDRVLDAEIEVAAAGFPERAYQQKNGMRPKGTPELDRMEWLRSWGVRGYTSSLDAAMTLVPEGVRLTFSEWDDEKHLRPRGPWQAILTKAGSGSSFNDMLGYRCDHAATPALAVCAASLRARAALEAENG